jgi:hypothetical protein
LVIGTSVPTDAGSGAVAIGAETDGCTTGKGENEDDACEPEVATATAMFVAADWTAAAEVFAADFCGIGISVGDVTILLEMADCLGLSPPAVGGDTLVPAVVVVVELLTRAVPAGVGGGGGGGRFADGALFGAGSKE